MKIKLLCLTALAVIFWLSASSSQQENSEPINHATLAEQAMLQVEEKQWAQAQPLYVELLRQQPDNIQAHINLAVIYAKLGNIEEARRSLLAVTKNDPTIGLWYQNLSIINGQLAAKAYKQALAADKSAQKAVSAEKKLDALKIMGAEKP